ncbi:hypothetical protein CHARACLAT_010594 [Characodon lateralis]|uniref:Uncharacterized protein n=1 Tax=Characodon lateralis TaxID=208331 RepID=A0ABU7CWH9_9TELE|nr:hypothetical protein [Characodon lateralis]
MVKSYPNMVWQMKLHRQGEWRAGWHRYIFALPNDTNTISWLGEQIESHSVFKTTHLLPYIRCVAIAPRWMLFNCMWVSSLSALKPKDMEFVSLPIQQPQEAVCEPTALLDLGP